ncbi:hypothetical protein RJ641_029884 [Dillenia turbinata]|uniref:Uncharacterized protein n=1 Tax=Dillenia turbinata TaxID=194707 RepID=A0AAN8ZN42_9MAGN
MPESGFAIMLTSWLKSRRKSCYLFLALCSPILLPFLCATFPIFCALELCLRIRIRLRREADAGDSMQPCRLDDHGLDHDGVGEVRLLQRYLEDQLILVGSMYDCGGDDDGTNPLLV